MLLALENLRQQMNRMVSGVHEAAASISLAGGELASGSQDLSQRAEQADRLGELVGDFRRQAQAA